MSDTSIDSPVVQWSCRALIAASVLVSAVSVYRVQSRQADSPFLSANDRSRWCTIAALVEDGSFIIDRWQNYRDPQSKRRSYQTIDRVRHVDAAGVEHDYSSKPTLLPVVQAAAYWLVRAVSGYRLPDDPFGVGRMVLWLVNTLPWCGYLILLTRLTRELCQTARGWLLITAAASFGTLLLPMTVTLNNHLPAAFGALVAWAALQRPRATSELSVRRGWIAGAAAGWMAACELPALALFALWAVWLIAFHRTAFWRGYLPAALLVGAAAVSTNYIAHQTIRPPYAQRSHRPQLAVINPDPRQRVDAVVAELMRIAGLADAQIVNHRQSARSDARRTIWQLAIDRAPWRLAVIREPDGRAELRGWGDWYDYEGSYWTGGQQGVDRGEASRWVYAFHALIGHHGVFSLTPFWLLVPLGVFWLERRMRGDPEKYWLMVTIVTASLVCMMFYLSRPLIDRNYGGVSCGFRWLFWLTPLWLWLAAPACDRLAKSRLGAAIVMLLIAASLPAVYGALSNPWQHPWLYQWWIGT